VDQLNNIADNLLCSSPQEALSLKLVDKLAYPDEAEKMIKTKLNLGEKDKVNYVSVNQYAKTISNKEINTDKVAVMYAYGNISDGKGDSERGIYSETFVKEFRKVYKKDNVKAIVLRVNSPGGSALASENIWREIELAKKAGKKVVVSMGDYAASGGYYISCNADYIFAEPNTITGSIGVFGMIPDFSKTAKDIAHVGVTSVKSNAHSDMFSLTRPFDKAELEYMQASIEDIYTSFINLVAEGRKLPVEKVDEIAQGRVWTGADALEIGLVDEIGTLNDAIAYAASLAGFEEGTYAVAAYPKPLTMMEQIMKMIGQKNEPDELSILSGTPFASVAPAVRDVLESRPARVMARMDYNIEIQ
jgi:protease-4